MKQLKKSPKDLQLLKITAKSATESLLDKEAIALYEKAIKLSPKDPENHYLYGLHLSKFARRIEEIAQYQKALELKSDYTDVYSPYSYALVKVNRFREADSLSNLALSNNSNDVKAKSSKAITHAYFKKIPESRQLFKELLAINPQNREALYNLAILEENNNNFTESLIRYEKILEFEPNDLEANIRIGVVYFKLGLKTESKNHFEKLRRKFPKEILLLRTIAEIDMAQGNINSGKALYFEILTISKTPDAYLNLADLYYQIGLTDSAKTILILGLEAFPENIDLLMEIGKHYGNAKNFDEAIPLFKRVEKINPKFIPAIFNLSLAYLKKGFTEEALNYINKAIALSPNDTTGYLYRVKSEIILSKGDYIESKKILQKVIEINPRDEVAWFNIGVIHINKNEEEQARIHLEKALQLSPNYSECRKVFIRFLVGQKKFDEALEQCELLRHADPFGADDYKTAIKELLNK